MTSALQTNVGGLSVFSWSAAGLRGPPSLCLLAGIVSGPSVEFSLLASPRQARTDPGRGLNARLCGLTTGAHRENTDQERILPRSSEQLLL